MAFIVVLVLYTLFLAVYWSVVLSILWHVKQYSMPQDSYKWILWIFLATIAVLNIISLSLFFSLKL
ncbi:hypothetical protein A3B05_02505 [Candidatus Giovannonibacteria bacterium RIFCSPLOWO2_01_FULL_43_160]|uniref:Uncharacterized protein n=1 Tax=Candidatus Giovannonibacteria bacterium RIFCSPLOWO2_12_FULL_43_26 TaxID=1798363 RepID=A0A1F5XUL9_9BACT|nr:MAG: hypothetical protein A2652_01575 [Candidatus Giovannonibacteria bacterium RIFCSPHIGHO2_01_FULL_43_140]OGF69880.1 MAG: hypothetical protein A3C76_01960 [Candidatus Giovannonibacteria bacterium RIFCSPHIGHO2_02_FULL_44_51]OGF71679.1 MAG: hypothetical protein A3E35_00330 [Candidatus Giovannonibacteria bacterium RIFCSPHIGHO2_12_FULL_44_22]OGF75488.1 MAG: hypothetical protein A3B05_02505 [Candidatus Giovannonibacteria bacterium RIFCSPLOWO2_01_FULL_43_160]OGF86378.1 MAG: hypothetical protein A